MRWSRWTETSDRTENESEPLEKRRSVGRVAYSINDCIPSCIRKNKWYIEQQKIFGVNHITISTYFQCMTININILFLCTHNISLRNYLACIPQATAFLDFFHSSRSPPYLYSAVGKDHNAQYIQHTPFTHMISHWTQIASFMSSQIINICNQCTN